MATAKSREKLLLSNSINEVFGIHGVSLLSLCIGLMATIDAVAFWPQTLYWVFWVLAAVYHAGRVGRFLTRTRVLTAGKL